MDMMNMYVCALQQTSSYLAICPFPRTRNLLAALLFVLRVLLVIPLVVIEVRAMLLLLWLETKGVMLMMFQWRAAADHKAGVVLRVQNLNMRMEKEKTVGYFTCYRDSCMCPDNVRS